MILKELTPRKALNKAFLKVKPSRTEIEGFKTNLITLLDRTNDKESEEFHKNLVSDFLKKTYYDPNHFINTKGRNDLVIHNGTNASSTVGVIIEAKKPTNKAEMLTRENINKKAFHELVLYYLRERITHKNLEVKHLVATNINEWFIFDATLFERLFAQNKNLVKQFNDFEGGRLADTKTDFFYKQIAEPFIAEMNAEIEFTYFNIQEYSPLLRGAGGVSKHLPNPLQGEKDNSLIALFKILSPEHLLKLPFTNDSNSLDKRFYSELLHIIGLTETKEGGKKIIERNKAGERHTGTILEDAIIQLDSLDKLSRLEKPNQFGNTKEERLFNVALELSITWINRILFLKLLEAQLINYHKGDKSYSFLNLDKIKSYYDLNSLFFQVLARKYDERNEDVKKLFEKVPYLNSSLFEPTDLEHATLFISNLKDDKAIPIFSQTVLKDQQGKKRTGNISTLQYLFEFLDAYDFGAEGGSEIQEDNKTLINASVLGLIFEKINGYKDGSFFTPGFITMYMCRETIRKAVVQKFNEAAKKSPLERGFRGVSPLERGFSGVSGGVSSLLEEGKGGVRRQIIPYNPKLKELARQLRNNSTKSEIILWKELKGKFEGKYDFHRQKPLDNYIADFFCYELKLVIEIDGESHNWEETQIKDFEKETRLNELGLNVLRFSDEEIFNHLESVLNTIRQYIEGFEKGDLSSFLYEDTPLNPLSRGDFSLPESLSAHSQPLSKGETHPQPLSRGEIHSQPLSRGEIHSQPLSRGEFKSLDDVYEQIGEDRLFTRQQANEIVNSIKICDPAVGSGHFLVSALNEMIAVKNDLKILQDRNGKRLKEYQVEVVNDELIVTDEEGKLFEYTPPSPLERGERGVSESQRVQETLFHEKQTIIENCLFGVDINPNSVKICRLRLWIELLKNAYYKHLPDPPQGGNAPLSRGVGGVLETLPNIDINIKCGNALVSRFPIDQSITHVFKRGSKWNIDTYKIAVSTYRNAQSKEQKREMERLIADIKADFRAEIDKNDPKLVRKRKLEGELFNLMNQTGVFELSEKEKQEKNKQAEKLSQEIQKLNAEIEEIKANKIFENAFEWRFEFPEVLNDDGDFVGFDVVIGNPPYIQLQAIKEISEQLKRFDYKTFEKTGDIYSLFYEKGNTILKENGYLAYITSNKWMRAGYGKTTRNYFLTHTQPELLIDLGGGIFEEATVDSNILIFKKQPYHKPFPALDISKEKNIKNLNLPKDKFLTISPQLNESWTIASDIEQRIKAKIEAKGKPLKEWDINIYRGILTGYNEAFIIDGKKKDELIAQDPRSAEIIKPILRGRDIKRYKADFADLWLINSHNGVKEKGIPRIDVEKDYPAIYRHLKQYEPQLKKRQDKGDHWTNLRNCAYIQEFEKEKIVYIEIQTDNKAEGYDFPCFQYDNKNTVVLNTGYIMTGKGIKYILSILNSSLGRILVKNYVVRLSERQFRMLAMYVNNFPIPPLTESEQQPFVALVEQILAKKEKGEDTTALEAQIDQLVYELYSLTEEEIKIVENATK
ncbi:MAG: hypothetical protein OHK0057_03220 [Thermoflexibacter sp.]